MTPFGVMKHLAVLEDAGLVTTRRRGREKLHYLNAVPIRLVHDRWVSKYAEPWAATLSRLKTHLEDDTMKTVKTVSWADGSAPVAAGTAVFEVFIKTNAGTTLGGDHRSQQRAKYSFGAEVHSDWSEGSTYRGGYPASGTSSPGTNVEVGRPRRWCRRSTRCWSDDVESPGRRPASLGDRAGEQLVPADGHP